jgi:hypothetical protein
VRGFFNSLLNITIIYLVIGMRPLQEFFRVGLSVASEKSFALATLQGPCTLFL